MLLATMLSVAVAMGFFVRIFVLPPLDEVPVSGLILFPVFLAIVGAVTSRAAKQEQRFDLRNIMLTGFALRGIGAVLRYSQPVDALVYHREGIRIADGIRHFDLYPDPGRAVPGTGWIRYVSGVLHVVDFDDMMANFLVFTLLSFFGAYFCYKAFERAVPDGNHRRYALLVFLWPSLVYWPSSLGKEAWMVFGIGLGSWAVSRLVTGKVFAGVVVLAIAGLEMYMVRQHIALMAMLALVVALLVRPRGDKANARFAGRLVIIVILLIGGSALASSASEKILKTDDTGADISSALDATAAQTEQGGAAFTPDVVRSPVNFPGAFVTVWFRPFPNEARGGGAPQLASSAENLLLLGLCLASWRRLRYLPRAVLRIPYVAYAMAYSFAFVFAFSSIANFGILARQRTQGTILFFVALCLPDLSGAAKGRLHERRRDRLADLEDDARRRRRVARTPRTLSREAVGSGSVRDEAAQ